MSKLLILSPASAAKSIELASNLMSIGRTTENDIHIQDHSISKRHGVLVRDGDDFQLHDFNSTNGTFVNGEKIMAVKLQNGASIRFGSVEARYESSAAKTGLVRDAVAPLSAKATDNLMRKSPEKDRGMSKRMKPDFHGSPLQSGPVTLQPKESPQPGSSKPPQTSGA